MERKGVEPSTSALRTQGHPDASGIQKGLTSLASSACTAACTGDSEPVRDDVGGGLGPLAAVLLSLSPAERANLAALLIAANGRSRPEAADDR